MKMNKQKVLFLILTLLLVYCKSKTEYSEIDDYSFIKGTNIHLRALPGQKSESLGFLQGGNKVKIISESDTFTDIGNLNGRWTQVLVLSGKLEKKIGYVFSPFILENGISPIDLINKEIELSERKNYLLKLLSDFKEYDEGDLYTLDDLVQFEILVTECKINRLQNPVIYKEKETLIKNFRALRNNFNDSEFEKMTSCEFLWSDGCGGNDLLPYPYFSYNAKNEIKEIIGSILIDSGDKNNCYRTSDNKSYCFDIQKIDDKYQISGICQMYKKN